MKTFQSSFDIVGSISAGYTAKEIEEEPMLFRASRLFAKEHGGNITQKFLQSLERALAWGPDVVIDSRSHMLMRGWYPCIPGWHHDDVPRSTPNGQPNYDAPEYRSKHLMAALDAVDAPTLAMPQLLRGRYAVPWPMADDAVTYAVWDEHLNRTAGPAHAVASGDVVKFDCDTFHRGMPAQRAGWRFFIRATWGTKQQAENKIRRNANVYLPCSTAGW